MSTTPRRSETLDYHDNGWEQGVVGWTPFAPRILRVQFPRSFTKLTDMGYDGSTDPKDLLDTFEGRMNCECAGDSMRYKTFPVTLAVQAMRWFNSLPVGSISSFSDIRRGYENNTSFSILFIIRRAVPRYPVL
ncbi:hypothetical protein PIB30_065784 [Stylosanthes scabra]|uniref:Uncharacterized protein n=1 Tax=Stylosanthes scabra TaxID=79078 RepID=A0ABU6WQG1_9FABA|nr:hypothetical protein [Stylosanthes scabra]